MAERSRLAAFEKFIQSARAFCAANSEDFFYSVLSSDL